LIGSNADYQSSIQETIALHGADTAAVAKMAKEQGVSVDFLQSKLDEAGVSAIGMSDKSQKAFIELVTGAKAGSAGASLAVAEMKANIEESAQNISDALTSAFNPLGDVPDMSKVSLGKLASNFQKNTKIMQDEAANVQNILRAGVPPSLAEQAISSGPATVAAIASMSDKELKKLVTSYEVAMEEMDAAILAESAHQEGKGKGLVRGFANAMLGSSQLPVSVSRDIVERVTAAYANGTLKPAALGMVQSFTNGLAHVKGISKKQGIAAVRFFVSGLLQGNFVNDKGQLLGDELAKGLHSSLGVTKAQAKSMVESITGEISKGKGPMTNESHLVALAAKQGLSSVTTHDVGQQFASDFALGISAGTDAARLAAAQLAASAKGAMEQALHNSPEYFTFHTGQDLVTDLQRGMTKASKGLHMRRPMLRFDSPTPGGGGHGGRGGTNIDLDVHIDRKKTARDLAWQARVSGN
jgi:hypothetical protein